MKPDIKLPAIFLTFDDYHVTDWYSWADYFDTHGVKATFYLSHLSISQWPEKIQKIIGERFDWNLVRDLQERGHTIGHHGVYHLTAAPWKLLGEESWRIYLEKEILQGFKIFDDQGIKKPHHFAYPRGSHMDETNTELLKHFDTLRLGQMRHYSMEGLGRERVLHAGSLTKKSIEAYFPIFQQVIKAKTALIFIMHRISESHIKGVVKFAEENGITFYPMEVLNR